MPVSGKLKFQLSAKKLTLSSSETETAHLRVSPHRHVPVARTAVDCMSVDKAHMVYCKQVLSAGRFVQMAKTSFEKTGVQYFVTKKNELQLNRHLRCTSAHGGPSSRTYGTHRVTVREG